MQLHGSWARARGENAANGWRGQHAESCSCIRGRARAHAANGWQGCYWRGREKGWRGRHAVAWSCLAKKKHWRGHIGRERENGEAEMRSDETLARPTCGLMSHWPRGSCKKQAETLYLASVRKFETARNWWNSGCRNKKLFETIACCSETNVGRRKLRFIPYSWMQNKLGTWAEKVCVPRKKKRKLKFCRVVCFLGGNKLSTY